jgi:beta-N-acetylhexosaminidase
LQRIVGQTIITELPGPTASAAFLTRVQRGEIGGVVLFAWNLGANGPATLIARLQAAATLGKNPPLVIAIDQEGGIVKRLPGAPTLAPPQMTTAVIAHAQGLETARNLARYGINVDLAPVTDVGHGGFITPRTFGRTPTTVSVRAIAFAKGLMAGKVAPTLKHFPGLGYATTTTDTSSVTVNASRAALLADLTPVRVGIAADVPLIMVSTATYPGLGVRIPAAISPTIVDGLLRTTMKFHGVAITDALATAAVTRYASVSAAAVLAIRSGIDMVTPIGTTAAHSVTYSEDAFDAELAAAERGQIPLSTLDAAYKRILAMKTHLLTHATG